MPALKLVLLGLYCKRNAKLLHQRNRIVGTFNVTNLALFKALLFHGRILHNILVVRTLCEVGRFIFKRQTIQGDIAAQEFRSKFSQVRGVALDLLNYVLFAADSISKQFSPIILQANF